MHVKDKHSSLFVLIVSCERNTRFITWTSKRTKWSLSKIVKKSKLSISSKKEQLIYLFVCVCVCIYLYTHTHTQTHTCTNQWVYINHNYYKDVAVNTFKYTLVRVCACVCFCLYVYTCTHICICMSVSTINILKISKYLKKSKQSITKQQIAQ